MVRPWRSPLFLDAYALAPHAALDAGLAWLMRRERPRWLVRTVIAAWVRRGHIDLGEVEVEDWPSVERFFLRRLKSGARTFATGLASPVDGVMVGAGSARAGLVVKGRALSIDALVGGPLGFEAEATTIFLTPDGYHRVHAPTDLALVHAQPIAGRSFPQNADALARRPDVYLRNARVVLRCETARGPLVLVMVGASLISGIEVAAPGAYRQGDELGAFRFGSTVVLLCPAAWGRCTIAAGTPMRLGQTLVP